MKRILLGHISGAHGIRGDVLVKTYTGEPEAIAAYGPLADEGGGAPLTLSIVRVTANGVVARVAGISDRTAAEKLKGRKLTVARDRLPAPSEDEFYHEDLVGLAAVGPDGAAMGTVVAVQNFGAGDLIEVRPAGGGATVLVPFTRADVPDIDFANGRMTVVPPPATADDDADDDDQPEGRSH